LPKKIEFNLLLPDLALKFGNPFRRNDVARSLFTRVATAPSLFRGRPSGRSASAPPARNSFRQE